MVVADAVALLFMGFGLIGLGLAYADRFVSIVGLVCLVALVVIAASRDFRVASNAGDAVDFVLAVLSVCVFFFAAFELYRRRFS